MFMITWFVQLAGKGLFTKSPIDAGSWVCIYTRGPLLVAGNVDAGHADYLFDFSHEGKLMWQVLTPSRTLLL